MTTEIKDFYDGIYRANPSKWSGEARDEFAFKALSEYPAPASLLDFGCGNGHTLAYFASRWPDTKYYGVDISTVALAITHKKLPDAFLSESIDDMPRVNTITMLGVLEHFESVPYIQVIADHLKKDGRLYIEVPNCLAYSNSKEQGFRKTTGGTGQMEWHLSRSSWERILYKNGFIIEKSLTGKVPSWEFVWVCTFV